LKLLVHTHAMLWFANDSKELSAKARKAFANNENEVFFSMASIWELSIKISLKKLSMPISLEEFIKIAVVANNVKILDIKAQHLFKLSTLPYFHRDPFDRLLVAQSMQEDLKVISKDIHLRKYNISCIW
jgi:PIN domain nuclease of toxin-antitoxin system